MKIDPKGNYVEGQQIALVNVYPIFTLTFNIHETISYYEESKPITDFLSTVLSEKFPKLKGLGYAMTTLDLVKDTYLYKTGEISGKRYTYRAVAAISSNVPLAGPSYTVGEFMYDYTCSLIAWINSTFTTQNILDSDLFPH